MRFLSAPARYLTRDGSRAFIYRSFSYLNYKNGMKLRAERFKPRPLSISEKGGLQQTQDTVATGSVPSITTLSELLSHDTLIITRKYELMNIFLGFEQHNRYEIHDTKGNLIGYIMEENSFLGSIKRQILRTHRPLHATVLNTQGTPLLYVTRPFTFINSVVSIKDPEDKLLGESHQIFHFWRRRYELFAKKHQFAAIDGGLLAWDFPLVDEKEAWIGFISRNFSGFTREVFTDSGVYAVQLESPDFRRSLSLAERATALGCAISIDFDYFSRHSGHPGSGGIFSMFPLYWGGGWFWGNDD